MDHQQVHDYLLAKPCTSVSQPFGEGVDVYKVKDRMFATLALGKMGKEDDEHRHWRVNLKCDPDEAQALRDIFSAVLPGYHMNKKLWNTVVLDGSIPTGELERMMDNSFHLVVEKMPKKQQKDIWG
ncbi:MmcQ/YjbR family DNA-binding protein [Pseudoalteromonas sp. SCSIO 43201]|uniref:MmcQ/YjbR family DNA-binding protein n=1 Tax=Pseudoalteromonas TaxID=53246 RepID=UPI0020754BEA|nr:MULTISPECIES: MmcQ/YjbR family DNA-binding protein [Pseudoalteromonas]MDW7547689.1 MmcQ/YjbR family DNA-binding protein [Pseudoalteromonas peptidolytica]USD27686.1 MmcQ/YjbR family DNA-binding protein [Pseudoalteromonas sp. SCSIO 43201]